MSEHPDDTAFLDAQAWVMGWMRDHCDRCSATTSTVTVGLIERNSGPSYEIRHCRQCIAQQLGRARTEAEQAGHQYAPILPEAPQI